MLRVMWSPPTQGTPILVLWCSLAPNLNLQLNPANHTQYMMGTAVFGPLMLGFAGWLDHDASDLVSGLINSSVDS